MSYENKTKEELIDELKQTQIKLDQLEKKIENQDKNNDSSREQRESLTTKIEFIGDFDVLEAKGINISEGGICFLISDPLTFEMRFSIDGESQTHRGHLVWVKNVENEGYHFGIKFVSDADDESIIPVIE